MKIGPTDDRLRQLSWMVSLVVGETEAGGEHQQAMRDLNAAINELLDRRCAEHEDRGDFN